MYLKTENLQALVNGHELNLYQKSLAKKELDRLLTLLKETEEAITVTRCCETLKDKNDEISELAKIFISEVDKKHPFVNLPEEEEFYMARHKLVEKLT